VAQTFSHPPLLKKSIQLGETRVQQQYSPISHEGLREDEAERLLSLYSKYEPALSDAAHSKHKARKEMLREIRRSFLEQSPTRNPESPSKAAAISPWESEEVQNKQRFIEILGDRKPRGKKHARRKTTVLLHRQNDYGDYFRDPNDENRHTSSNAPRPELIPNKRLLTMDPGEQLQRKKYS
jgi:hypothetical protein